MHWKHNVFSVVEASITAFGKLISVGTIFPKKLSCGFSYFSLKTHIALMEIQSQKQTLFKSRM